MGIYLSGSGPEYIVMTGYENGNPLTQLGNGNNIIALDNYGINITNAKGRRLASNSEFVLYAYDYNDVNSQFQVGSKVFFSLNGTGLQIQSRSKNITLGLDETGLYVNGKKVLTES